MIFGSHPAAQLSDLILPQLDHDGKYGDCRRGTDTGEVFSQTASAVRHFSGDVLSALPNEILTTVFRLI
jgi:hypothetical protein